MSGLKPLHLFYFVPLFVCLVLCFCFSLIRFCFVLYILRVTYFKHLLINSFIHLFIRSFVCLFIYLFLGDIYKSLFQIMLK